MPKSTDSDKSFPKIVEYALGSLREHEKNMDQLVGKLEEVKTDISANLEKISAVLDKIDGEIAYVEDKIELAKQIILKPRNWYWRSPQTRFLTLLGAIESV